METNLIRRIDDLGRVVIPKEIRKKLNIRDGDAFSLSIQRDDTVCFTKFNTLFNKHSGLVTALFETLRDIQLRFAIYNREKLVLYNVDGCQRNSLDENTPTIWNNICCIQRRAELDFAPYIIPIRIQGENLGYIKVFTTEKADKMASTIQYISGAVTMIQKYLQGVI